MRYRLLASYQGAPYEAGVGPTDADVVLFAACPPPEELGFEPATGHWRKQVRLPDVQTLHESRPVGIFRGERCIVLDDLGDRLHIVYLGHDAYRAEQIGYWEVDRGVFELITPRHEVTEIVEQRLAFPHREDGGWQAADGHQPPVHQAADQPADYAKVTGYQAGASYGTASYPTPAGADGAGPTPGVEADHGTSYPGQAQDAPDLAADRAQVRQPRDPAAQRPAATRTGPPDHAGPRPAEPGQGTGTYPARPPVPVAHLPGPGRDAHAAALGPAGTAGFDQPLPGMPHGHPAGPAAAGPSGAFAGPGPVPAPAGLARDRSAGPASPGSAEAQAAGQAAADYLSTDLPGVALPMMDEPPLPLEAQALRAAHRREHADHPTPQPPVQRREMPAGTADPKAGQAAADAPPPGPAVAGAQPPGPAVAGAAVAGAPAAAPQAVAGAVASHAAAFPAEPNAVALPGGPPAAGLPGELLTGAVTGQSPRATLPAGSQRAEPPPADSRRRAEEAAGQRASHDHGQAAAAAGASWTGAAPATQAAVRTGETSLRPDSARGGVPPAARSVEAVGLPGDVAPAAAPGRARVAVPATDTGSPQASVLQAPPPPERFAPDHALPAQALPAQALPARDLPALDLRARDRSAPDHALPAEALPAQALLAQALPARDLPARDLPALDLPARDLPARDLPALDLRARDRSAPDHALPAQVLPAPTLPAQALPAQTLPAQTLPAQTLPARDRSAPDHALPAQVQPALNRIAPDQAVPAQALPVRDLSARDRPAPDAGPAQPGRAPSVPPTAAQPAEALHAWPTETRPASHAAAAHMPAPLADQRAAQPNTAASPRQHGQQATRAAGTAPAQPPGHQADRAAPAQPPDQPTAAAPQAQDQAEQATGEPGAQPTAVPRRRRAAKRRMPTQRIFSDLASQAAIPATAYAVGEDVDGAMCLMRTGEGFEVFNSAAGARHEVRVFSDEESAYFYLFGVLVADAVRTGALVPRQ